MIIMTKQFSELDLLMQYRFSDRDPRLLVDVGAHVGSFCAPFAEKGWRVIAFEPEPNNHQELVERFKDYPNVVCIKKGVSYNSKKEIDFYVSDEHWGIHSLRPFHKTHQRKIKIETVRLDKELAQNSASKVTLLKVDTEGADYSVLQSFDFETNKPELVVCEFFDERTKVYFDYTHHDVVAHMSQYDYSAFISEWAPITEYGRKGVPGKAHTFLNCGFYPLDHEPNGWGNLIFVPKAREAQFEQTLSTYLRGLQRSGKLDRLFSTAKLILSRKFLSND